MTSPDEWRRDGPCLQFDLTGGLADHRVAECGNHSLGRQHFSASRPTNRGVGGRCGKFRWMPPARKIAFIGSHSVRKTNAVHSFAGAVGRSGRSVEVGREVVRFSPMGMNERATPEAQLWVIMAQIREELELRSRAEVLVLDRALIDNFAYFLRATKGQDPFDVTPFLARWSDTYDLYVRLRPDTPLLADGVRSTNERFRNEIEKILDMIIPKFVPQDRLIELWASEVTDSYDWPSLVERLCGPPLRGPVVEQPVSYHPTLWD